MSVIEQEVPFHIEPPDISHIITEDDEPVDNIFSAKQQRLLVEPLYSSWRPETSFVADANVGVFSALHRPPIVPDMFLSLDVALAADLYAKENRTYFVWEFGKPSDVAIEIVSNRKGGESDRKLAEYARIRVTYYAIYDPLLQIQSDPLQVYELNSGQYILRPDNWLPQVDLGLMLWEGAFEGEHVQWLRWCDLHDNLILTGAEATQQERERAEQESTRADQATARADQESARAAQLVAKLRELGVDPDEL